MNVAGILSLVETLTKFVPVVVQAGTDLKPYAVALYNQINGKEATPDQRAALEAGVDAMFARLMEPLPPAQEGDPDYVKPTV